MPHRRVPVAYALLVRLPALLGLAAGAWGFMRSGKFAYLLFLPYFVIVYFENAARERQAAALMREAHTQALRIVENAGGQTTDASWFEARIFPSPSIVGPVLVVLALVLLAIQE